MVLPPVGRLSPSGVVAEPPSSFRVEALEVTWIQPHNGHGVSDNGGDPESLSGGDGGKGVFARSLLILWFHLSALGTPVADDTG